MPNRQKYMGSITMKVNANDLLSGRVKEHTLFNCKCGVNHEANIQGTVTGRISSNDSNIKSNTPKSENAKS